jgi:hypothetical protein
MIYFKLCVAELEMLHMHACIHPNLLIIDHQSSLWRCSYLKCRHRELHHLPTQCELAGSCQEAHWRNKSIILAWDPQGLAASKSTNDFDKPITANSSRVGMAGR